MKHIAYIPLCPLGDVLCCINQLEHIKRLYAPCHLTVFAIPLIAQLMRNYRCVDQVVELKGSVKGGIDLTDFTPPDVEYDVLFNMSYYLDGLRLQERLKTRICYGGESYYITPELCQRHFDKWVTNDYWNSVTLSRYANVCGQLGETLRLADPSYDCAYPVLSRETYQVEPSSVPLPDNMVLFMPGTSGIAKYWPISKYIGVAKVLKELGKCPVFVIGPQDRRLVPDLQNCGFPVLDTLPLPQLADAILHAELIVGNDTGPMHFAAAFQRPTVHVFASSSAFNWFPYQEPLHTLIMPECGEKNRCRTCTKTCIGTISTGKVLDIVCKKLGLRMPVLRHVAFFVQDRIGDSLTMVGNIEETAKLYAPCETTVFSTAGMLPFFQAYAFADKCVLLQGTATVIPNTRFDAVFNHRYDRQSVDVIRQLHYDKGYGYENADIPEDVCREIYTGGYLPLTLWDDVQLRRYTSVSEQAACLIRLVEPEFHCQYPSLAPNTLVIDWEKAAKLKQPRKSVLFVLGGSYKSKCWPLENYLRLAQECVKPYGFTPFFLLGPEEKEYMPFLEATGFPYAFCAPLTEIAGLAVQWLQERSLAIGNDTGVMHLLKILDIHTITLSANDTHFTWEPYAPARHIVLYPECSQVDACATCRDCKCMELIPYETVRNTAEPILEKLAKMY